MKAAVLCHIGAENACINELASLGVVASPAEGYVMCDVTEEELSMLTYRSQTATRILIYIDSGDWDQLDLSPAHELIGENESFAVRAETLPGSGDMVAVDIAASLGGQVDRKVDLETPDKTIFCQVGQTAVAGIDICGDLSKRYYRVFANARSVKGTLAASILWAFDTKSRKSILDPHMNSGEIAIEAALRSTGVSPRKYEAHLPISGVNKSGWEDVSHDPEQEVVAFDARLANIRSAKKNAKLAGVEKAVSFSKIDPEWLDVKFGENDVDLMVTIPFAVTKREPSHTHIKELFYQAEYILKNGGAFILACATEDTVEAVMKHAAEYKFSLSEEVVIYSGQLPYHVMQYEL